MKMATTIHGIGAQHPTIGPLSDKTNVAQLGKTPVTDADADNKKKRKAEHDLPQGYTTTKKEKFVKKEEPPAWKVEARSATPPPASEPKKITTPGRVGPIRRTSFSCTPNILPFKGTKGKKVRKTAAEKDAEYKQFVLENEQHVFHALHVCYNKGPNGSPTYDEYGFELDYKKVADWMKPKAYNKRSMVNGMERHLERRKREDEKMKAIFFEHGEAPERSDNSEYWKDRVSKDLNVPWHRVGVKEFEEWERRGFKKARKGDYENITKEDRERMLGLMSGASLRK
ncbi:hypothetical protein B0O99DRAFT_625740 [Bisporella sp. PMI_857]|nr:hypothetical protein B0O99DRAFT_625740 [Bisporella sp. PMI_857]